MANMYTTEVSSATLRLDFEHWLCQAIRCGARGCRPRFCGSSVHQDAVLAAREEFEAQLDGT